MYKCQIRRLWLLALNTSVNIQKLSTEFLQAPARVNYVVGWVLLQVAGILQTITSFLSEVSRVVASRFQCEVCTIDKLSNYQYDCRMNWKKIALHAVIFHTIINYATWFLVLSKIDPEQWEITSNFYPPKTYYKSKYIWATQNMNLKFVGRFSLQQRKNAPSTTKSKKQTLWTVWPNQIYTKLKKKTLFKSYTEEK